MMNERVMKAVALIQARDETGRAFASAAAKVRNFESQLRGVNRAQALASRHVAAQEAGALSIGRHLAGAAAAYLTLSQAREAYVRSASVERRMTRTGITGDATLGETRDGMSTLQDLSRDTALGFDDVAKGMDSIVASGRSFRDALAMMPSVAKTAQASGAEVNEIAESSTALIDHMKISIEGLGRAQDALARGGELGKFELRDMARYLPSILPIAKNVGIIGQEGLEKLTSMLQVVRGSTGTAEEAAAAMRDAFVKLETDETANKFKKMGVDLRKEMEKARKEGVPLFDKMIELTNKATKGDLSKLPQLFGDLQSQTAMRALVSGWDRVAELQKQIADSAGTVDRNLARVLADSQSGLDRLAGGYDRARIAAGKLMKLAFDKPIRDAAEQLDVFAQKLDELEKAAKEGGVGAAIKKGFGDIVQAVRDDRAREVRQWDDDTLGARQVASGWQSARHEEAAAAAERDAATTRGELDARRAQAEKAPRHAALAAHVKRLEEKLARQEGIARAEREKSRLAIQSAMPRLPDEIDPPNFGMAWAYPDREGFARFPDTVNQRQGARRRGDVPAPPARPSQTWFNQQTGVPTVPVAPLDTSRAGAQGEVVARVEPGQIVAKAELSGQAEIKNEITVNINAGALQSFIEGVVKKSVATMRIHTNGPGSTGVSSPDAQ